MDLTPAQEEWLKYPNATLEDFEEQGSEWWAYLLMIPGVFFWGIVFRPILYLFTVMLGIKFYQIIKDKYGRRKRRQRI